MFSITNVGCPPDLVLLSGFLRGADNQTTVDATVTENHASNTIAIVVIATYWLSGWHWWLYGDISERNHPKEGISAPIQDTSN